MPYSTRPLRKYQISNPENTVGTTEVATEVLMFENCAPIIHDKVWHFPKHDRGLLADMYEPPIQVSQEVELEAEGDLYDREMVFVAANSIRGNVTPTQPESGTQPNHYLWTFEPGLTTQNTPDIAAGIDTFTFEWGDNVQGYETSLMFTKSWEISGEVNEAVKLNWTFGGRQVTEAAMTGALTAPTTHQFFATNKAKWFVDANYAGIGGTQKSGVLKAFKITFETGFTPRFTTDGNYYFEGLNEDRKKLEIELTLWRDSTIVEAELDKFQAGTTSYQRIALFGATEMDSGQSNPPYVYFDFAGKYVEFPPLDDEDGTSVITVKLESTYDVTAGKMFGVKIGTRMSAYA